MAWNWYKHDLDRTRRANLPEPPAPVFVMGLHRSGTTILYEELARQFSLAKVGVYEVVNYENLLHDRSLENEGEKRRELDALFARSGAGTRQVDGIRLSHDTPEEYGWILARRAGSLSVARAGAQAALREVAGKLAALYPGAPGVALKNPWDAARGPQLLEAFPRARFLYVLREPIEILNSQLKNALHYGAGPDPLLDLLLAGIPAGRLVMGGQRALRRGVGQARYEQIMLGLLARDVAANLAAMRGSIANMPADSYLLVDYDRLAAEPARAFEAIEEFLGLGLRRPFETDLATPGREVLPAIAHRRARLERKLGDVSGLRDRAAP